MPDFDLIAFDADDTLWHTESLYHEIQQQYAVLLAEYGSPEEIEHKLYQTEKRNMLIYGYGTKAFALSMIETAINISQERVSAHDIQSIIGQIKRMLNSQVVLLDHAAETIAQLSQLYPLMLITKGDLYDQENKIKRSGLHPYFQYIEVVSEKDQKSYRQLAERHSIQMERFLMVGNSIRYSDGTLFNGRQFNSLGYFTGSGDGRQRGLYSLPYYLGA
jgi:putative hydrolase of the HAD superfamily